MVSPWRVRLVDAEHKGRPLFVAPPRGILSPERCGQRSGQMVIVWHPRSYEVIRRQRGTGFKEKLARLRVSGQIWSRVSVKCIINKNIIHFIGVLCHVGAYVSTCVSTCVSTHACVYVCMCVRMYVCTYVRMYVCTCMCVRMYVCTYVRMYVCICVCMYVYVCVYVCMYANTCNRGNPPDEPQTHT